MSNMAAGLFWENPPEPRVFIDYPKRRFHSWGGFTLCGCKDPATSELVALQSSNGVLQYRIKCCHKHEPFGQIAYHLLTTEERNNARIYQINEQTAITPCERCGDDSEQTERHHWAPHSLFFDSDEWPTSYLCKKCHNKWHHLTETTKVSSKNRKKNWTVKCRCGHTGNITTTLKKIRSLKLSCTKCKTIMNAECSFSCSIVENFQK